MAFLIRLAKHKTLRSKPTQFSLQIRHLETKLPIKDSVQIEWIRGSRRTAAIVDTTPSNDGNYQLVDCKLTMRATMFLSPDSKNEQFLSKSSKILFKTLDNSKFETFGEIQLDLSGCCTGEPIHLQLNLKNCKDKHAIVDFDIIGDDAKSNSDATKSHYESSSFVMQENDEEAIKAEDTGHAPHSVQIDRAHSRDASANIKSNGPVEGDTPKMPKLTPTEEYLSIQLESTKSRLNDALYEVDCLRGKVQIADASQVEILQLRNENTQLREQINQIMSTSLSFKDTYEDCSIECQRLNTLLEQANSNLHQERGIILNMQKLVIEIGRRIDFNQECEIDVKQLSENQPGCELLVEELEKLVTRIFQLRSEVKDRQSQVERIGLQQQQVVDKWKALAGKTVTVTADGDVQEIDLNRFGMGKRRSSLTISPRNNVQNSATEKLAVDSSFDLFRLEIQHLKQELEAERSQYRKAILPESSTVDLEEQLLQAKVRMANLAEALTFLEEENKHLKEQMVQSEWSFGFNKSVKHT